MGDTRLDVQKVIAAGIDLTDVTPLLTTETYLVRNDGQTFLHFKKASAVDCVVTVLASGGDMHCGPYPKRIFNDGNNDLKFTLSNIAGLTVAIARL